MIKVAAIHRHALAVAFHFQLLKVGRQARKALIIGQNRARRVAQHLIVPDTDKRVQDRQVPRKGGGSKMVIHCLCPAQKGAEILWTNGQHNRQANRPPHRISPANPVFEPENAGGVDAPFRRCGQVG